MTKEIYTFVRNFICQFKIILNPIQDEEEWGKKTPLPLFLL